MNMKWMSTAAAVALAASFAAASAQTTEKGAPGGAMEKSAPAEHGGAMQKSTAKPTAGSQAQGAGSVNEARPERKAAQGEPAGANTNSRTSSDSKMGSDKDSHDRAAQRGNEQNEGRSNAAAESGSGKTVGAAPSSETKLTTEQRTQVREKVLATGPRASNLNFAVNVGTVVPRDVRIVEVPSVIIDIHPEWRGYRYFVVGDQIVIVEPDSLRIIAVLDV